MHIRKASANHERHLVGPGMGCHYVPMTTIGILHPGQMGVTIGSAATNNASVIWAGDGRSSASRNRAEAAGLTDVGSVGALCAAADVVVSICPPSAALDVAGEVAGHGFSGTYIDANAVSPATAAQIGEIVDGQAARFIDGGVIGPPANTTGTTRMYLAGQGAAEVTELWAGSLLDVRPLAETSEGAMASALKMAYAGWTKGQSALLLAINALASEAGVLDALRAEWEISQPGLIDRTNAVAGGVSPKAWRFSGEMTEIADTMASTGVPDGFHRAAAMLYHRMAEFKDQPGTTIDAVITAINRADNSES